MGDEYGDEVVGGVDRLSSKVRNQKVDPRDYHVIMKSILLTYSRRELVPCSEVLDGYILEFPFFAYVRENNNDSNRYRLC